MIVSEASTHAVDITERAFNFGDGHFTTIKIDNGLPTLADLHLERLTSACQRLHIAFDQWSELRETLFRRANIVQHGVIKIVVSRGCGGQGYSAVGATPPNVYLLERSIPSQYALWAVNGIEMTVCSYLQTVNPQLGGLKTLNRLDQVMVKLELEQRGGVDGIVCTTDGHVAETSCANLFWCKAGDVYTPDMSRSGVAGVMRHRILDVLRKSGVAVHICDAPLADVLAADEVFISNAVMGVIPVNRVDDYGYATSTVSRHLQDLVWQEI